MTDLLLSRSPQTGLPLPTANVGLRPTGYCFPEAVLQSPRRLAMPIAVYPGLALTGATVRDVVNEPQAQFEAQAALHQRHGSPFLLSAMDLSAEAEAFGCALHLADNEIPSVTGRLVTSADQADKLRVPRPGDKRTAVYLETVSRLRRHYPHHLVLGGCIGPFSLAARLAGVSEALELTLTEPALMQTLLEKSAEFLIAYVQAFKAAGADGLIMAEPAAGLLSPRGMAEFSSAYVRLIAAAVDDGRFSIILHNCAAKLVHLPAILETGLRSFHFGAPMDLPAALAKVAPEVVLCGNLDPTSAFVQSTPEELTARAHELLAATRTRRNFVLSSGCDIPPAAALANLDAFYQAVG
jgi:uroporphyrinogen decarboxylase